MIRQIIVVYGCRRASSFNNFPIVHENMLDILLMEWCTGDIRDTGNYCNSRLNPSREVDSQIVPGLSAFNLTTTYPPDGTITVSFSGGLRVLIPGTFRPSHEELVQVGLVQRPGSLDWQMMSG